MNFKKMYSTIDTHVAGEAFRIVIHSSIILNEDTIQLNNKQLQTGFQTEKAVLLNEPRGHRDMHGCIVLPSEVADYGLLFFNHDEEVQFKYGGLVTTVTALLEMGHLKQNETNTYTIETVDGVRRVKVTMTGQEVTSVYVENDTCVVQDESKDYHVISVDGQQNYLIFNLPKKIPNIHLDHLSAINEWGKKKIAKLEKEQIAFDGVIVTERIDEASHDVRSVTFERDGSILRSPGFDSTWAILTLVLDSNEDIKHLS